MKILAIILGVVILLLGVAVVGVVTLMPSCNLRASVSGTFAINTVTFELDTAQSAGGLSGIDPPSSGPGIWIDTNVEPRGLWGGTVESHAPYAIAFDYTDNAGDIGSLEFTRVAITYNDGASEPAAAALTLPITVGARVHETVNSMSGGRVVRSTVRVLSGRIPGVITRDEAFRLVLEGRYVKKDGSVVPFAIDQRWVVVLERSTKPAGEVLRDK